MIESGKTISPQRRKGAEKTKTMNANKAGLVADAQTNLSGFGWATLGATDNAEPREGDKAIFPLGRLEPLKFDLSIFLCVLSASAVL